MDQMVSKLLDADREARQLLEQAEDYRVQSLRKLEAEKQRLRDEYGEKRQMHIQAVQAAEGAGVDDAVEEIRRRKETLLSRMEEHYNRHHGEWEDQIFRACTGG